MKIERKTMVSVPFKDLKIGDVFINNDGDVCMKTEYLFKDDVDLQVNTVTLDFGALLFNEDNNFVWVPKFAKLTLEE